MLIRNTVRVSRLSRPLSLLLLDRSSGAWREKFDKSVPNAVQSINSETALHNELGAWSLVKFIFQSRLIWISEDLLKLESSAKNKYATCGWCWHLCLKWLSNGSFQIVGKRKLLNRVSTTKRDGHSVARLTTCVTYLYIYLFIFTCHDIVSYCPQNRPSRFASGAWTEK